MVVGTADPSAVRRALPRTGEVSSRWAYFVGDKVPESGSRGNGARGGAEESTNRVYRQDRLLSAPRWCGREV